MPNLVLIEIHGVGRRYRGYMEAFNKSLDHLQTEEVIYQDILDEFENRANLGPVPMKNSFIQRIFTVFGGDGIGSDGPLIKSRIYERFDTTIAIARRKWGQNVKFVFIAHSMGTKYLWSYLRKHPDLPVYAVFLAGSPMRYYLARAVKDVGLVEPPHSENGIINFLDPCDPIVGKTGGGLGDIANVTDVVVKSRPSFLTRLRLHYFFVRGLYAHISYFRNRTILTRVKACIGK